MKHFVSHSLALLACLTTCLNQSLAQSGWSWQNPLPQGNDLWSVSFTNANTGTAVGVAGTILRTSDGGATWVHQTSGTASSLYSVSFTDADNGTAVGGDGTILRTTNGGSTWTAQTSGTANTLWGVSFTDANTGTAVGQNGTMRRTTDGGISWTPQFGSSKTLFAVSLVNASTGTAVGMTGKILRTTDGGANWVSQDSTTITFYGIASINASVATIVGAGGYILRTTNGGSTWTSQTSGTLAGLRSVSFTDVNTGTAVGWTGTIVRTTNGGATWTIQTSGITTDLMDVSFTDANNGTAVGSYGVILRTTNGGTTWTSQRKGITKDLRAVSFIDVSTGTAVGFGGSILRTTNGGSAWASQISGRSDNLYGVSFVNANIGTAVGNNGLILRTTDGGVTDWFTETSGTTNPLYGVSCSDGVRGTAVGAGGTILRTTNGGSTWTGQTSGTTNDLYGVCFIDGNTGTAVGASGTILRTTNGGSTWTNQASGVTNYLYGVSFIDANTGAAVGDYGTVLRTSNGGSQWTIQSSVTTNTLYGITLADASTATAVGASGVIVHTTNGGSTWTSVPSGTLSYLYGTSFSDASTGTVVGTGGTILRTTTGGVLIPPPAPVATGPTNQTVSSFTAHWNASTGATGYRLDVAIDNGFVSRLQGYDNLAVTGLSQTVSGLNNGTNYYYRVRSENAAGPSGNSNTIAVVTVPSAPVATNPTSQTASSFAANWNASNGATGYRLDVATDNTFGSKLPGYNNLAVAGVSQPVSGLNSGTTYYYRVRAENPAGSSVNSNSVTAFTIPSAPLATGATGQTVSSFVANWNASNGTTGYRLDVATDNLFASRLPGYTNLAVGGLNQLVSSLNSGTTYYYQVRAENASGPSGNSNAIIAITLPAAPVATNPTSLTISSFVANWNASTGATGYRLDVATDDAFASQLSGYTNLAVSSLNQQVSGLNSGSTYHYRVRAENASGPSVNSNTVTAVTIPAPPVATNATDQTLTSFTANWNGSTGATGYLLDVATDTNFTSILVGYNNLSVGDERKHSVTGLTSGKKYFYRVRASNSVGTSGNSNIISLITTLLPPSAPTLISPPDLAVDQPVGPTLVWGVCPSADSYQLRVWGDSALSNPIVSLDNLTDTLRVVGPLSRQQWHFWQVTAKNSAGSTSSPVCRFRTVPPPPIVPVLRTPANGDSLQPTRPQLNWDISSGATAYHVQISADSLYGICQFNDTTVTTGPIAVGPLADRTKYYWHVRAKNAGGWSDFSGSFHFTVPGIPPNPALISPAHNEPNQEPGAVQFGWTDVGAASYDLKVALDPLLADTVVTASNIVGHNKSVSGLAYNTTYYWSVRATGANGLSSGFTTPYFRFTTKADWVYPTTTVNAFPASPTTQDYRMVSFPGGTEIRVNQVVTGSQMTDWRVFRDTGGTASNHLAELGPTSTLNPGEGYWLLTRGVMEFKQTVTMPALDAKGAFDVSVRRGWNIIGNPFGIPIPWGAILAANPADTLSTPQTWNGKYEAETTALQALKGYYVYKKGPSPSLRIPFPFATVQKVPVPSVPVDWQMAISYSVDGSENGTLRAGVSGSALEGFDALDEYHPPVILDQPDIFFRRPAWDEVYDRFSSDIRRELGNGRVWEFDVRGKRMGAASVRVSGTDAVPAAMRVVLIRLQNSSPIDMRITPEYSFVMAADHEIFRLIIGTEEFAELQIAGLMPSAFALSQNFPNPFNPSTTITFDVARPSEIDLEVVSVLGQRVTVLARGTHKAGRYSVIWDTQGTGGRSVATGVYYARLIVDGRSVAVRKMIFLK